MATLGEPITKLQVNNLMDSHNRVKQETLGYVQGAITTNKNALEQIEKGFSDKCFNFFSDVSNIFIFSKEEVLRFFDGASTSQANYLMIILGAQLKNDQQFSKGSPTVIIAGCNDLNGDQKTFETLQIDYPGTEHPPKQYKKEISLKDDGPIIVTLVDKMNQGT